MIEQILTWLATAGRIILAVKTSVPAAAGSLADVLVHDLANDSASLHNYETGQAVIAGALTVPGESGRAIFVLVKEHGPAYQDLFGEEPAVITPLDAHGGIEAQPMDAHGGIPTGDSTP